MNSCHEGLVGGTSRTEGDRYSWGAREDSPEWLP
eukprot:gene26466-biopygen16571